MEVDDSSDFSSEQNSVDSEDLLRSNPKVFMTQDSYEEIQDDMNRSFHGDDRVRLPSGIIDEIIADQHPDPGLDALQSPSSLPPSESSNSIVDRSTQEVLNENDLENNEEELVLASDWRNKKKHVFILSSAGKPIYSRYGDENKLVTIMGVMQALMSVVNDSGDTLRCVTAGEHKFVFLERSFLTLVMAAQSHESLEQLMLQLSYVYSQVISVLTFSQLERIFKKRNNFDLRRLLTGAEKFIDNLITTLEVDPSCFLSSVRCLPLEVPVRDSISNVIAHYAKQQEVVFAILLSGNQLISLVRMKKYSIHPMDLHLIFNLVSSSESFKNSESWTPICLPKFDSSGYLHTHVSYLDAGCHCCLLLCSVNKDVFFKLAECKQQIQEKLLRQRNLQAIVDAASSGTYVTSDLKIPDVRHFMYKQKTLCQWTRPEFEAPYTDESNRERLFFLYKYLHRRVHCSARPGKVIFHVGKHETLLAWVTNLFELYVAFSPLVTKAKAVSCVDKLLKWLKKYGEKYFILNFPTI